MLPYMYVHPYWMPIHYDNIEDGQNKTAYFILSYDS